MSIDVRRGGETANTWSNDPYSIRINVKQGFNECEAVVLDFKMPSKGGGVTEVRVDIEPDIFEKLAKLMMEADDAAAITAFGKALAGRKP